MEQTRYDKASTRFECIEPILCVREMAIAVGFYKDVLGFENAAIKIRLPPTSYAWALEMQIEDPDGNVLRIGSEPR
jgi:hypothetical protein